MTAHSPRVLSCAADSSRRVTHATGRFAERAGAIAARGAPMRPVPEPRQNHLLAALPAEVQARVFADLELKPLPLGQVLYESGAAMGHVYFPTDSIVSLALPDGKRCLGRDLRRCRSTAGPAIG